MAAGCVAAASNSPIGSFNDSLGQHVFYFGGSYHVRQLYYAYSSDTWVCQDLTASTGAPVAASGSALTSFVDSEEHVVYEGTNQHVYHLVTQPGEWIYQDLTSLTGAPTPVKNSVICSTTVEPYEFVFYITTLQGNPGYELFYSGAAWSAYQIPTDWGLGIGTPIASAGEFFYWGNASGTNRGAVGPDGQFEYDENFLLAGSPGPFDPWSETALGSSFLTFVDP